MKHIIQFLVDQFLFEKPQDFGVACSHLGFRSCFKAGLKKMIALSKKDRLAQYLYGLGTFTNKGRKRIGVLLKWARKDFIFAQRALGKYYYNKGKDLEKEGANCEASRQYREAAKWLLQAEKGGEPSSIFAIGQMLFYGRGFEKNPGEARKRIFEAVDFGEVNAISLKVYILRDVELTRKAATIGDKYAQDVVKRVSL